MNKLFLLVAAVALLASCGSDASPSNLPQKDSVVVLIDTLDRFDTISANGYTITLQPATEAEFMNTRDAAEWRIGCSDAAAEAYVDCLDKWIQRQFKKDTSFVKQIDSVTISVSLNNGSFLYLRDTVYAEGCEGSTRTNSYVGQLYRLPWIVVGRTYYEAFDAAIYNLNTGEEVPLQYYPVLSPQKNWLLVYNYDLEAGYTFNGLQLVNLNGDKATIVFEKQYEKWGATNVKWVSANEAIIEQSVPDYSSPNYALKKYYARLVISEK